MAGINTEYVGQAVEELISKLGVKESIPLTDVVNSLRAGKIKDCITMIAGYLGLPITVDLSTVELAEGSQSRRSAIFGERFESKDIVSSGQPGQAAECITAQVLIPSHLPIYGSSELQGFHVRVKVSDNCQKYPITFIAVMAHEFSHIVLHSIMHRQKDNEVYTDLTAMILGFSEIIRKGRKTVETKRSSSRITTTTTTYGYLSDEVFSFALDRIENKLIELREKDKELQEKMLGRVAGYRNQVSHYESQRQLLCLLMENLDLKKKKTRKQDTPEIVRMHELYFLDRLADVSRHHARKLKEISESSLELAITHLYTEQRIDRLNASLQRVESLISDLQKNLKDESDFLGSKIAILERNVSFLDKRRIRRQLQQTKQ